MRVTLFTAAVYAMLSLPGCGNDSNEVSARDAAPGPISETSPPSAETSKPAQNEPSSDTADQPPR
jgi:hypothetical protein